MKRHHARHPIALERKYKIYKDVTIHLDKTTNGVLAYMLVPDKIYIGKGRNYTEA